MATPYHDLRKMLARVEYIQGVVSDEDSTAAEILAAAAESRLILVAAIDAGFLGEDLGAAETVIKRDDS